VNNNSGLLKNQYELIKSSREVVFQFCEKISNDDYTKEVQGFGRGNIRNTHAHIGSTYIFWLAEFGMKKEQSYPPYESYKDLNDVRQLFEKVDDIVSEFINSFNNQLNDNVFGYVASAKRSIEVTALQLFIHVITHEFHHKGQIMSMSRILGYPPPDADIIRFT
jgi:uncharacterized damage-inducible protein DinB